VSRFWIEAAANMWPARTAGAARPRNQPVAGQRWKLRFDTVDAEFTAGKTRAKIHGHDADFRRRS